MDKSVIVVVGGSKGIGLSIVESCLYRDLRVVSLSRSKSGIIHENLYEIECDVSVYLSLERAVEEIKKNLIRLSAWFMSQGSLS